MISEQQIIAAQAAEIERLKAKVTSLEDQLYWLRKKIFGKMSEKNLPVDPNVLSEPTLFDEPLSEEERAELEAAVKNDEEETSNRIKVESYERKPRKAIDTANLEVREEHVYPEVDNIEDYTEMEPEVTDTLVIIPAQIYVRRVIRHKLVAFTYDMGSRSYETARKLLRGYHGTIQTDGYDAYDQFEHDPHIQVLGCWAHARRKWADALDEDKKTASEALSYINRLYHIENDAKENGITGDNLRDKRQKEAYPVILQFEKWINPSAATGLFHSSMQIDHLHFPAFDSAGL